MTTERKIKGTFRDVATAAVAVALAALTAAPAQADWRSQSPDTSTFVPIGQHGTATSERTQHPGSSNGHHGPIVINNGTVIVLPGNGPDTVHTPTQPRPASAPTQAALPLACLETVWVNRDEVRVMEGRCLTAAGIDVRTLPGRCGIAVTSRTGIVRGFEAVCLGTAGYRLTGR